jgi:hypothetical protein
MYMSEKIISLYLKEIPKYYEFFEYRARHSLSEYSFRDAEEPEWLSFSRNGMGPESIGSFSYQLALDKENKDSFIDLLHKNELEIIDQGWGDVDELDEQDDMLVHIRNRYVVRFRSFGEAEFYNSALLPLEDEGYGLDFFVDDCEVSFGSSWSSGDYVSVKYKDEKSVCFKELSRENFEQNSEIREVVYYRTFLYHVYQVIHDLRKYSEKSRPFFRISDDLFSLFNIFDELMDKWETPVITSPIVRITEVYQAFKDFSHTYSHIKLFDILKKSDKVKPMD